MHQLSPVGVSIFLLCYVIAQMAIGVWFGRGAQSDKDYYIAGGRLGVLPLAMSIFATWFGAETILGSAATIAQDGLAGARAEPFGYAIGLTVMAILVAKPIRDKGYITIADFFRDRYGRVAELACAVITAVLSVIWAGAQLLAISAILETAVGIPGMLTLIVSAGVVITYCYFAGMMGDVATDVVQGVFLIIGMFVLLFAVAGRFGGFDAMIGSIDVEQLRLVGPGESVFSRVDNWAIPVIGSIVTQEVITRFLAAKSNEVARRACYAAAALYLFIGIVPVTLGLAGAHLTVAGGEGDNFIPALAIESMPSWLSIFFIGALFSAILSTIDSNLLAVSSLVSVNILSRSRAHLDPKRQLFHARMATVAAGIGALVVAVSGSNIYELIAITAIFGQGGIVVATLFGLWTKFGAHKAAMTSIIVCCIFNIATIIVLPMREAIAGGMSWTNSFLAVLAGDLTPIDGFFLYSVLISIVAYFVVAMLEGRKLTAAKPA